MVRFFISLIAVLTIFFSLSAFCGPQSDSEAQMQKEKASESFTRGLDFYDKGQFAQAAEAFREANGYLYNWKILYNIGQSEAAARRYGMALEAFEEYLARSGDEISLERRDEVMAEVARLRQIVGMLEIRAPIGARVQVDSVDRGTAPLTGPVLVASGVVHDVRVILEGVVLFQQQMKLTGGQEKMIDVTEGVAASGTSADTVESSPEVAMSPGDADTGNGGNNGVGKVGGLKLAGWIAVGAGAALAAGGLVIGAVGFSEAGALEDRYDGPIPGTEQGEVDRLNNMALVSDILMGAGVVVAATGIVLLAVQRHRNRKMEKMTMMPTVAPGFSGMVFQGRF